MTAWRRCSRTRSVRRRSRGSHERAARAYGVQRSASATATPGRLRDCTLAIPAGSVTALVGPNGAGKTTLLQLTIGLVQPTPGSVEVFGRSPRYARPRLVLPQLGFVAQDHPLHRSLTVDETLRLGQKLNPRWDDALALDRVNASTCR